MTIAVVAALSVATTTQTRADDFQTLFSFPGGSGGAKPNPNLAVVGSTLYGTTSQGGAAAEGTIFSLNTDGTNFDNMYSFGAVAGGIPKAGLTVNGSTLYGTTSVDVGNAGNGYGFGTVFSIGLNGSNFTTVHAFDDDFATNGGLSPVAPVTIIGSTIYGTTPQGGVDNTNLSYPNGTVYSVNLDGSNSQTVHAFTGPPAGADPVAGLTAIGSTLYGTAPYVLFSMNLSGSNYEILHSFGSGQDGLTPRSALTLGGSTFFGTTHDGGAFGPYGTVFSINTDGSNYQVLHSFTGTGPDGAYPDGSLTLLGSRLYGTTVNGGNPFEYGTIFSMNLDGSDFRIEHSFVAGTDGAYPNGGLTLVGATLYGTTTEGGGGGVGTIFAFTPSIAVPEPGTLTLAVLAVLCSWFGLRRSACMPSRQGSSRRAILCARPPGRFTAIGAIAAVCVLATECQAVKLVVMATNTTAVPGAKVFTIGVDVSAADVAEAHQNATLYVQDATFVGGASGPIHQTGAANRADVQSVQTAFIDASAIANGGPPTNATLSATGAKALYQDSWWYSTGGGTLQGVIDSAGDVGTVTTNPSADGSGVYTLGPTNNVGPTGFAFQTDGVPNDPSPSNPVTGQTMTYSGIYGPNGAAYFDQAPLKELFVNGELTVPLAQIVATGNVAIPSQYQGGGGTFIAVGQHTYNVAGGSPLIDPHAYIDYGSGRVVVPEPSTIALLLGAALFAAARLIAQRRRASLGALLVLGAAVVAGGALGRSAAHAATLSPGDIVLLNPATSTVYSIDPVSGLRTILSDATHGTGPAIAGAQQVAVNAQGQIFLAQVTSSGETFSGDVLQIDPATGNRAVLTSLDNPAGAISIRPDGKLLVGAGGESSLVIGAKTQFFVINPQSGAILSTINQSTAHLTARYVTGAVEDQSGNIFAAEQGLLVKVSEATGAAAVLPLPGGFLPLDLTLNPGGTLSYVSPLGASAGDISLLGQFDPTNNANVTISGTLSTLGPTIGAGPSFGGLTSLAREANGDFIVTGNLLDFSNPLNNVPPGIFRVDPVTGDRTLLAQVFGSGQLSVAVVPNVPEPSTLALAALAACMAASFGARLRNSTRSIAAGPELE